jgi:PAS domain S-box-containing protein
LNNKPAYIALVMLMLFIGSSIWLVFQYVSAEKQRDLDDWQARLGIMAESQQHAVESWFAGQSDIIGELAANPLLQIYVSQLSDDVDTDNETSRGQLHHLKNLINATAEHAAVFTAIKNISNNQHNKINDGLALVNEKGLLLATRYFPVNDVHVAESYKRAIEKGAVYISNIYDAGLDENGRHQPRLIIAAPVSTVQSVTADDFRAVVVAVINPENNLFKLLLKEWVATSSEESLLVSLDENSVNYLTPLKNGFEIFHTQARYSQTDKSTIPTVVDTIGGFAVLPDYRNILVLATARQIRNTAMMLVQEIEVDEALAESRTHQQFILTIFLLIVFIIAISFIAIWRHATSLHLQKATRRLEARAALLNAVGDSINDHIFLLDHKNKLVFINDALARSFSIENVDIRGKALNHIFNNEITEKLLGIRSGDDEGEVRNKEMRLEFNGSRHDYHISIVTLNQPGYKQSSLYVMHDITELKDSQGRRNRLMEGIIATLAQVIDKHDPHCAHHSERTREVAVAIAQAMGLPKQRIDVLAMAALLANIGKLYIPTEMLTNVEPLTAEEEQVLRQNTSYSVEILQGLDFDGPVIEFVQQKNECLDGSGYPKGESGEAIHQESRILSVANAFVAMTSSRAYRTGKPIREVLDILMSEADTRYDRHVIAALFHIAENHSDWVDWQQVN